MSITAEQLANFPNPVFFETGMGLKGKGIAAALETGKFTTIHSTELHRRRGIVVNRRKYRNNPNVIIHHGDSGVLINELVPAIDQPITFWLDAHTPRLAANEETCPIFKELEAIRKLCRHQPKILVDDMDLFSKEDQERIRIEALSVFTIGGAEASYIDAHNKHGMVKNNILVVVPKNQE